MSPRETASAPSGLRLESDDPDRVVLSWPADGSFDLQLLSASELEVLVAILRGDSDDAIAIERGTSVRTVAAQTRAIYRKLGVSGRRAMIALFGRID